MLDQLLEQDGDLDLDELTELLLPGRAARWRWRSGRAGGTPGSSG